MRTLSVTSVIIASIVSLSIGSARSSRDTGISLPIQPSINTVARTTIRPTTPVISTISSTTSLSKTGYNPVTDVSSGARVKPIKHPYYRESRASYDLYMSSGVYLFRLHTGLQTIWNSSGTTATATQSGGSYDLVVNGGYFTYDGAINSYLPAGRIVDGLRAIRSMVWSNYDVNLRVTILYDRASNFMRTTTSDVIIPRQGLYAFYTGPQLIASGQILTGISSPHSHRLRKTTRTFMIIDQFGHPHVGVTIQGYTLPALATKIQEMQVFSGAYEVINMDGGSSTALIAGARSRNSRQRLPWFFGVKQ